MFMQYITSVILILHYKLPTQIFKIKFFISIFFNFYLSSIYVYLSFIIYLPIYTLTHSHTHTVLWQELNAELWVKDQQSQNFQSTTLLNYVENCFAICPSPPWISVALFEKGSAFRILSFLLQLNEGLINLHIMHCENYV